MRMLPVTLCVASLFLVVTACGSKNQQQQPNTQPTATAYPGYPGYPQQGQYPQGQYPQGQYPQGQ